MSSRWVVNTPTDAFDDVHAAELDVEGGCLIFRNADGKIVLAYAAGTWNSVVEDHE